MHWYIKEEGIEKEYKALKQNLKSFKTTYMYIKKFEQEYGNELKSLCDRALKVHQTVNTFLGFHESCRSYVSHRRNRKANV